jgi:hypothetical protein
MSLALAIIVTAAVAPIAIVVLVKQHRKQLGQQPMILLNQN